MFISRWTVMNFLLLCVSTKPLAEPHHFHFGSRRSDVRGWQRGFTQKWRLSFNWPAFFSFRCRKGPYRSQPISSFDLTHAHTHSGTAQSLQSYHTHYSHTFYPPIFSFFTDLSVNIHSCYSCTTRRSGHVWENVSMHSHVRLVSRVIQLSLNSTNC